MGNGGSKLKKLWNNPKHIVFTVGILSILIGTLYLPVPWYILGAETEAEIGVWGLSSVIGGLIACIGSTYLSNKNTAVQKGLHIIALLGMILFILAQVLPLFFWIMFWVLISRRVESQIQRQVGFMDFYLIF